MAELSAFDVHKLVNDLQFLVGGKIDNIYQLEQKDIYLQIYVKDKPKQLLRLLAGKCFYLATSKPEFPENPMRFCTYLRKYLANARIISIEQLGFERIIKITLETKDTTYELFTELFGKGNFILVKNNMIVSVAEEQVWADRTLKSGESYVYPKKEYNFLELNEQMLPKFLRATKQETIVKALAADFGLGSKYAELALTSAAIDKNAAPAKTDAKKLFSALKKLRQEGSSITMDVLEKENASQLPKTKEVSAKAKEIKKIQNILESQAEQLKKVLKEVDENRRKGELIYEQYQEIKDVLQKINTMKGKSEEEIKNSLKSSKIFKNFKERGIIIEL